MHMNRCSRPRWGSMSPCGQMPTPMPMPMPTPMSMPGAMGGFSTGNVAVERVVEPTVHCAPNIIQHHKKIEHIVPVVCTNIHECHTHHDYIVQQELIEETVHCNHGERPPICQETCGTPCGNAGLFAR